MTLMFFCTSLEPGRDGVGDYTRRLAGECAARGHACVLVALHDPHVPDTTRTSADGLEIVRLPVVRSWPERLALAIADLRRVAPDWVSWQFVAYGFHPRGFLPAALLESASALRGARCHVMLHELWLGLEVGSGPRARALGWLQRRGVVCLLDQLDPDLVHTSNAAYDEALAREGCEAAVLGLFGNVPIAQDHPRDSPPFARWLPAGIGGEDAAPLVGVTFGTLHPQWRPRATVDWLLATARRLGRAPALLALGRAGAHAAGLLDVFRDAGVAVAETGELDEATVSRLLAAADFGLAPHPWALVGKSGAAAAMLEHGLPVLVPRDDWRLRGPSAPPPPPEEIDPLLTRLADIGADPVATARWLAARRKPASALPRVATAFFCALEEAPSRP